MRIKTGNVESFEEDPGQNRVSPLASALSGISDALKQVAQAVGKDAAPAIPPTVEVKIPERPRKWLFKVGRDSKGDIATINAEALD